MHHQSTDEQLEEHTYLWQTKMLLKFLPVPLQRTRSRGPGQKCLVAFLSVEPALPAQWALPGLFQFCDIASDNDVPPETDHHKP